MTIQEMIDLAMLEGAATQWLWYNGLVEQFAVKFVDTGEWFFMDERGEHIINEDDAVRLIDCYRIGYINL